MAGYAIFCYIMGVKDRHNGNIMIDREGHIFHIDFGFILDDSPRNLGFETAPFKITIDDIDIMQGKDSEAFNLFKVLFFTGFKAVQKYKNEIINIIKYVVDDEDKIKKLNDKFKSDFSEIDLTNYINGLIYSSVDNFTTAQYDNFQRLTNGIL